MHAVVLTFPGHLFQTVLSVRSIQCCYPEVARFSFVLDDVEQAPWHSYAEDFVREIGRICHLPFDLYYTHELEAIKTCVAGWWRQQLVKLCLDLVVPGDAWFVVDGDSVFDTRCEVQNTVPVTRRHDKESRFGIMSKQYVRTLLGTPMGHIEDQGEWVCTNAIPFRYLDRSLLLQLREHVQHRWQRDFVHLHLDWFQDQTIVADHDPPDRMTMSEWELIECFRRYVLDQHWPLRDIGSGYAMHLARDSIHQQQDLFRHAYQWDAEIGEAQFDAMGITVSETTWQRCVEWHHSQRVRGHRA